MALSDWGRGVMALLGLAAVQVAWAVRALFWLEVFLTISLTLLLPQSATTMLTVFPAAVWLPDAAPWYVPALAVLVSVAAVEGALVFAPSGARARRARAAVLRGVARARERWPLAGAFAAYAVEFVAAGTAVAPWALALLALRQWTGFDGWPWFGGSVVGVVGGLFLGLLAVSLPLGDVRPHAFRIRGLGPALVAMQLALAGSVMMVRTPRKAARQRARILEAARRAGIGVDDPT